MPVDSMSELEGRKHVRLRLRHNVQVTIRNCRGQTCFVVKDPVTLRYFHLDETQHFLLGLMDGTRTLAEIRQAYEAYYRPHRLSEDELEGFARQLLEAGLVLNESPGAARLAVEQWQAQRRRRWLSLLNIFYFKIPLGSPDRWLARCHVAGSILFSPWFVLASMGLFLAAAGLLATHWRDFAARLPEYREFLSWQSIFLLWMTLGTVKVLHELGHAFCCKRMGAEVAEIGMVLLFFFPTLYCNASDSWTLPDKWKRIAVSLGGVYVELILASLATFLWWVTDSNTVVHNMCFAVMTVCTVTTILYNANPLMRFDGYYVLSDWIEIPNLAQQAGGSLQSTVLRWLGIDIRSNDEADGSFLFWFGLASVVYRWYVTALMLYFLFQFLKIHDLAIVGSMLIVVALVTLIGVPVYQFARWLHRSGRMREIKPGRRWIAVAALGALAAAFFLVPLPRTVHGVALVQVIPDQVRRIVIPDTGGFLAEIRVRDGQRVKAGEIVAVLSDPKLEIKLRLNEADRALRHQQQDALIAQLTEIADSKDIRGSDWQQCEQELKTLVRQQHALKEQQNRLVLRAPLAGVVMGVPSPQEKGKWLEKDTELCRIGNDEALRALVLLDPADHRDVAPSSQASVRIHGLGARQYSGVVTGIAQVEAENIPAALSARVAGDIPTRYDPVTNRDVPRGQHYLVSVQFNAIDAGIHPGVLGRVKIDTEARTLWWRLRRYVGTTLNWGL